MSLQSRRKTFTLGLLANNAASVVSIVTGIITIPIGVHYFGATKFGIWAVIFSIIAYLEISNLGVTTGTAALIARTNKSFEKWFILKKSLSILVVSSLTVLVLLFVLINIYPDSFSILGRIPQEFKEEAIIALKTMGILFLLNLPLTIFYAGFVGIQKLYWERFYFSLTSICGLIALCLTVLLKGNLVTFALYRGVGILLCSSICSLHFILTNRETHQEKNETLPDEFSTKSIIASSLRFLSIGIAAMIVLNMDNLIISNFVSLSAVTPYFVTFKPFGILFSIFSTINYALWPMYGRAASFNDWEWIQRIYNNIVQLLPVVGGLVWIGGILFSEEIITLWVNFESYGGLWLVFFFGAYGYILSMVNTHSQLLTGMNLTKNTVFIAWVEAAITFGFSILFVHLIGILGVALSRFLSPLITVCWMTPIAIYIKTNKKIKFNFYVIGQHFFLILLPCLIMSLIIMTFFQNGNQLFRFIMSFLVIILYIILSYNFLSVRNTLIKEIEIIKWISKVLTNK